MKKLELTIGFSYKDLSKKIVGVFVHKSSLVLFAIGLIFLGYCAFIWYKNVHSYQWDEVRKQEYMNNKNAGTNLNRVKFEKTLKDIERRKEEYDKKVENVKDIFRLGNN